MSGMLEYRTQGFNGYGVKYSPFFDSRIAVAAFDTQDSLFDLSWSERHENQLVTACGDGSIKLFDIGINEFPIQSWQEHQREVFSVHWNLVAKDNFCSSSWDGTIKIWSPERSASIATLPTHSCTYSASWSPHSPSVLSSVSSDSHLRIFDLRTPPSAANHLQIAIPIHSSPTSIPLRSPTSKFPTFPPAEALTHDWNKYRDTILATGGVDRLIRTFDLRAPKSGPIAILAGHDYAVRKLTWSPHLSDLLLSASYDMTCRVWTDAGRTGADGAVPGGAAPGSGVGGLGAASGSGREIGRMSRHTEFVTGVDWCLFGAEGWCASCGWDERLCVWDVRAVMAP